MPRAFRLIDRAETPDGPLELRQRGERDFMITIGKRVLMSSTLQRSERALAELGCAPVRQRAAPHVLIGGLGLGFTLRAALDALPASARVEVAELNQVVHTWCRGPLAVLTDAAVADPRVAVVIDDVMAQIRRRALGPPDQRWDAILLDLYLGPQALARGERDPLYGRASLRASHAALTPGGVYAVWAEEPNPSFEQRLRDAGFQVQLVRPHGGGPRHAVYLALKPVHTRERTRASRAGPTNRS